MTELVQSASTSRTWIAPVWLRELAERQWGVVGRRQLRERGIGDAATARAIARGWLVRVHPGVYALGHAALAIEGRLMAAVLYAGPDAALSHTTAGWLWGLLNAEPTIVHVKTRHRRRARPGLRLHVPRRVDRVMHRGLPVSPPAQTLLELAAVLSFDDLRRGMAEADHRGLLDPPAVIAGCGQGRPGSSSLRRALATHLPQLAETLSPLEERFLLLCEANAIPLPEVNPTVAGLQVDALWRKERIIVELDGHKSHARPAAVERDRQRELTLRTSGYTVVRYTWQQVTQLPNVVVADLRGVLRAPAPDSEALCSAPRAAA